MKQKDVALIILVVAVSAVVSFFIANKLFPPPKNRQQQVDVVQPITADFPAPDKSYFNKQAFDPTQAINVGQNANSNPFNSPSQ